MVVAAEVVAAEVVAAEVVVAAGFSQQALVGEEVVVEEVEVGTSQGRNIHHALRMAQAYNHLSKNILHTADKD